MTERRAFQERRLQRYELSQTVEVKDLNQGVLLGTLVNIHEEGLLMVGVDTIQADHVYQVALCLPESAGSGTIELGVDCLWVREAEELTLQWSGCQIIDVSDAARSQIKTMIEQLGR